MEKKQFTREEQLLEAKKQLETKKDQERQARNERAKAARRLKKLERPQIERKRGPFTFKRISLFSWHLKQLSIEGEMFGRDFAMMKEKHPMALADRMADEFHEFICQKTPGVVHAVTMPPRSKRNLEKIHPSEEAAKLLATKLGVPFIVLFEPWNREGRGIGVAPPTETATINENTIGEVVGKNVWMVDDVCTSGRTLQAAQKALWEKGVCSYTLAYLEWNIRLGKDGKKTDSEESTEG